MRLGNGPAVAHVFRAALFEEREGRLDQAPGPFPQESNEYPDLPRLLVPFNRSSYARLRQLIDFVNTF